MTTTADWARQDRLSAEYGVVESGAPVGPEYHATVDHTSHMTLGELSAQGGKITRVRLLSSNERGYRMADVSYIHGQTPDGQNHHINLQGLDNCYGIPMKQVKGEFIQWAKNEGVYAKGLGLLDEGTWSVLW